MKGGELLSGKHFCAANGTTVVTSYRSDVCRPLKGNMLYIMYFHIVPEISQYDRTTRYKLLQHKYFPGEAPYQAFILPQCNIFTLSGILPGDTITFFFGSVPSIFLCSIQGPVSPA